MKKFAVASISALVIGTGAAFAADLPVKAPPAPVAPVYSWTGFYVGANVGYGWTGGGTSLAGNDTALSSLAVGVTTLNTTLSASGENKFSGLIGGGEFGYNYQVNRKWLVGIEADLQGSDQHSGGSSLSAFTGTYCSAIFIFPPRCAGPLSINPTSAQVVNGIESKIDWFGTVRGRVGALVTDNLLVYGTGGHSLWPG
jgi:outer membrane immunogenic protein